ncbi:hypothetical protein HK096_000875 [Nowakowskiella sp. JEL0078]|nr:hypothetical protein HK096_000875 [Nowakowskiella sp. JEL0078]
MDKNSFVNSPYLVELKVRLLLDRNKILFRNCTTQIIQGRSPGDLNFERQKSASEINQKSTKNQTTGGDVEGFVEEKQKIPKFLLFTLDCGSVLFTTTWE